MQEWEEESKDTRRGANEDECGGSGNDEKLTTIALLLNDFRDPWQSPI